MKNKTLNSHLLLLICFTIACFTTKISKAQIITTYAGTTAGYSGDGGPATASELNLPDGVVFDNAGNLYIADWNNYRVRKVTPAGTISTIAGNGTGSGLLGDGGTATAAMLQPIKLAIYGGDLYISDGPSNNRIRVVTAGTCGGTLPMGIYGCCTINTYAGGGHWCDGCQATNSTLYYPTGIVFDGVGNLYIADRQDCIIRMVDASPLHIINTIAGSRSFSGCSGDGGLATNAKLGYPTGITLDASGNIYFTDNGPCQSVRRIDAMTNIITTIAGNGTASYSGDGGPATAAELNNPCGLAFDICGNLLISDETNDVLRSIDNTGTIYSIAVGTSTATTFSDPKGIVLDVNGNIYVSSSDGDDKIKEIHTGIQGPVTICTGSMVILTNFETGGTWVSGNNAVATINTLSGLLTGISAGTAIITYTPPGICPITTTVTVLPAVSAITGVNTVCLGNTTVLTDGTSGGTWSSSNTGVATVGSSSGSVFGVSAGTTVITYETGAGCYATFTMSVRPDPAAIGGTFSVCTGQTTGLTEASTGGAWTSSNTGVATVTSTGVVSGVSAGTSVITFSLGASCIATAVVTVIPMPVAITGATIVCLGNTITLSDGTAGGTWSSGNTAIGTVGSATGITGGISPGTVIITYSMSAGCYATISVSVRPDPAPIGGHLSICLGQTYNLTEASIGGTWSSSNTAVGTVSATGVVGGVSAGTTVITYSLGVSCIATAVLTVNPNPAAITGSLTLCAGQTNTLADGTGGGSWSSSNTAVGTVGSATGIVGGISAGTTIITYALPTGCIATATVVVNPMPGPIAAFYGSMSVCVGGTNVLYDVSGGSGTWSTTSTNFNINTYSGVITGLIAGTGVVTYTLGTGCYLTATITVNPLPAAITGPGALCVGGAVTLADATTGGTWASSNTGVATITSGGGMVAGISAGTTVIDYILPTGCTVSATITVNPAPAPITGPGTVCVGSTIALGETTGGGSWVSSNTSVATVDAYGDVTGVTGGTAVIDYILATGCYAGYTVTVNPLPAVIAGPGVVCMGGTITLTDATAGGTWTSSNPLIATIDLYSGVVTGIFSGTAIITYTLGTGCFITTTVTVPTAPAITGGPGSECVGQSLIYLTDPATGGAWSIDLPGVATIATSGGGVTVTGVSGGVATVTYIVSGASCTMAATYSVTISPLPTMNPNPAYALCISLTLTADMTGTGVGNTYTWAPATGLSATTGLSVICSGLTGAGLHIYTITCTNSYGCVSTALDTVVVMDCGAQYCFGTGPIFPLGGTIGSPGTLTIIPPGDYYVYSNITFNGVVVFNNAVVAIAPGLTLNIDPKSDLEIQASHLFCCSKTQLWKGLVLQSDAISNSGNCHIGYNSLIEDADTAVVINYGVYNTIGHIAATLGYSNNVFTSDGAIFNRNIVGVSVFGFPSPTASYVPPINSDYPFYFGNTVFTSRDLSQYNVSSIYYPMVWPEPDGTTTSMKEITGWILPGLLAPYNVDNPNAGGTGIPYNKITCKDGTQADIGIYLNYVGAFANTTAGPTPPAKFSNMIVGAKAPVPYKFYTNLFDYLHNGILANYSNLECYSNSFIHMYPATARVPAVAVLGAGVYATAPQVPLTTALLAAHYRCSLQLLGDNVNPPVGNIFYDCEDGVYCKDYYYITGLYSQMFSDHGNVGVPGTSGNFGYNINSWSYYTMNISHNNLNNMSNTGIFVTSGVGSGTAVDGNTYINSNIINGNYNGAYPFPYQSTDNAIVVRLATGGRSIALSMVMTDTNSINYVRNGITVQNFNVAPVITGYNTIWLVKNLAGTGQQFGINHANCHNNTIWFNTVTGPGADAPSPLLLPQYGRPWDQSLVGVYNSVSGNTNVDCNEVDSANIGYEFYGQLNPTKWYNNVMQRDAQGYVLEGQIGTQLSLTPIILCNNLWHAPIGWWTYGGPKPHNQTLTLPIAGASVPSLSPLIVNTLSTGTDIYDPPINNANPSIITNFYGGGIGVSSGPGLITFTSTSLPACEAHWVNRPFLRLYHSAAQQAMGYVTYVGKNNWMAQMALWNTIANDTTLADSTDTLQQFWTLSASSRFARLNSIEQSLINGDSTTASILLSYGLDADTTTAIDTTTGVQIADDNLADTVVQNYLNFYKLLLKYQTSVLSSADTCLLNYLANLCPKRDGAIVYEARGLWNIVFDDPGTFNDNCDDAPDSTNKDTCSLCAQRRANSVVKSASKINLEQKYIIYPNPNDGSFTLQELVEDGETVTLNIADILGRQVYNTNTSFEKQKIQMQIDGIPAGIYTLQITDSKGNKFILHAA